jgi:hypothetical protein
MNHIKFGRSRSFSNEDGRGTCLEGLNRAMKNLSQDSRCSDAIRKENLPYTTKGHFRYDNLFSPVILSRGNLSPVSTV